MEHEFDYYTAVDDFEGTDSTSEETRGGRHDRRYRVHVGLLLQVLFHRRGRLSWTILVGGGDTRGLMERGKGLGNWPRRPPWRFWRLRCLHRPVGQAKYVRRRTSCPTPILVEVRDRKVPVSYAECLCQSRCPLAEEKTWFTVSIVAFKEHVELLTK